MSVFESDTASRPANAETKLADGHEFADAPSWRDGADGNPYSPAICISLLLLVCLAIKFGPTVHSYVTQTY